MAFSNRVLSTTQTFLMDKLFDQVLVNNPTAMKFMGSPKPYVGRKMEFPIKFEQNSTFQVFKGFEAFNTNATNEYTKMEFDPSNSVITVALPLDEIAVNQTSEGRLRLMSVKVQSAAQDLAQNMGVQFHGNGGGDNFNGLGNMVDNGTTASTYGGLSRTTYPVLNSTVTASGGTVSLEKLNTLYYQVSEGVQQPTMSVTTKAITALYQSLLNPQERIIKEATVNKMERHGGTGFKTLDFMGMPVIADSLCATGVWYMINENFMDWYALPWPMSKSIKVKAADIEGNDYNDYPDSGFSFSDWIKSTNSAAITSFIYTSGQFILTEPRYCGKLTGITGV